MKQLWNDNSALSYSLVTIAVTLVVMSVFWIGLAQVINVLSEQHEADVGNGDVSAQTHKYYNLSVNLFKSTILFGILGLALWGIKQSKQDTSDDSKSLTMLVGSSTVMLVFAFVSVILSFSFAHTLDMILAAFVDTGMLDYPDVSESSNFRILDIFYLSCIMPGVMGIAIHLLTSVQKIGYSSSSDQYSEYYVPEGAQ